MKQPGKESESELEIDSGIPAFYLPLTIKLPFSVTSILEGVSAGLTQHGGDGAKVGI